MDFTCGIFLVDQDNKLLIGHPTNAPYNLWSIPKGIPDDGEAHVDAALREFFEETTIALKLNKDHLLILPHMVYSTGKKTLIPFLLKLVIPGDYYIPECHSMVTEDKKGMPLEHPFPEIDEFKWVNLDEADNVLHEAQARCLDRVRKIVLS